MELVAPTSEWIWVGLTDQDLFGSILISPTEAMYWEAASIGLMPRCGLAAWACLPSMRTSTVAQATWFTDAQYFPNGRSWTGRMWEPTTISTPSRTPSLIMASAPWRLSSAGWNARRTFPFLRFLRISGAAARRIAAWASWPQAWMASILSGSLGSA